MTTESYRLGKDIINTLRELVIEQDEEQVICLHLKLRTMIDVYKKIFGTKSANFFIDDLLESKRGFCIGDIEFVFNVFDYKPNKTLPCKEDEVGK